MTDSALQYIPRFDFGDESITLTYPVTRWIPGARSVGSVMKTATGDPGPVLRLRKYTLAMTLRFTEPEWPSVSALINFGQTGQEFEWFHGQVNDDIPASFMVTLGAPSITSGVHPSRDGTVPWLMLLSIVLESSDAWYLQYFGHSEIPVPDTFIFVARVEVVIADIDLDNGDTTTASVTLYDIDDNVIDPSGREITWNSSNLSVAVVDQDGNITGTGVGTADITASCEGINDSDTVTVEGAPAIDATGGTMFEIDGYIYHIFTASGNFVVTSGSTLIEELVVAGGGGAGSSQDRTAGGGGGGGFIETTDVISVGSYPVVVGAGGLGGTNTPDVGSTNGGDSSFNGIVCIGGGRGAGFSFGGYGSWGGGSGGGQKHGIDPAQLGTPGQGFDGGAGGYGSGSGSGTFAGSGGGGASEAGVVGTIIVAGRGGNGKVSSITGVAVTYAGGGGGSAANYGGQNLQGGAGGTGGGGAGATGLTVSVHGTPGTNGLGGGGGAGAKAGGWGGNGGSGVVIIRYPLI